MTGPGSRPDDEGAGAPLAVLGLAVRLPGAADDAALWRLLQEGEAIAGPIEGAHDFDPAFFNLSVPVAARTDPRHRLVLEASWQALEDAGVPAEAVAGSDLGVWVAGSGPPEHWDLLRDADTVDVHGAFGSAMLGTAPGLVSYFLDARGPSIAVDATCSAALTALHAAATALRAGQCGRALVAAANVVLTEDFSRGMADGGVVSPSGRCRFGDVDADGYVRSEGVAALLLAPLAAVAPGDRVRAVLHGIGVSNNGRRAGSVMAPSEAGQEQAIRGALADAGLGPEDVDFVEAHGTGTPIGDRVEAAVLGRVFGSDTRRCPVGSVKSNVGHTEAASGLVGMVKAVLALEHRELPATLHVERPVAGLDGRTGVVLARRPVPLAPDGRLVAGVNCSGLSGTNVHVVLGSAPDSPRPDGADAGDRAVDRAVAVPLSAHSAPALRALATRWARWLDDGGRPGDLAVTAARRSRMRYRHAVVGRTSAELALALRDSTRDEPHPASRPPVLFVFPGQGGQWEGMAAALLDVDPVFTAAFDECDRAVTAEIGRSVRALVVERAPLVGTAVVQPAVWAVQVALGRALIGAGIVPDTVVGHSMGEIAAAVVAGALDVVDGARVVCRRARLLDELGGGAMVLVPLGRDEAETMLGDDPEVAVAVVNGDRSVVVSGTAAGVERFVGRCVAEDVPTRRVDVDYGSHGPHVAPLESAVVDALPDITPRPGTVVMRSTVTTRPVEGTALGATYWARNLVEPVLFAATVAKYVAGLGEGERPVVLEIGPHPLLLADVEGALVARDRVGAVLPAMVRGGDRATLLAAVAGAFVAGAPVDWAAPAADEGRVVGLPPYPWSRRALGLPRPSPAPDGAADAAPAGSGPAVLTLDATGRAPLEVVAEAVREAGGHRLVTLRDVVLAPSAVERAEAELRVELVGDDAGGWRFTVRRAVVPAGPLRRWEVVAHGTGRGQAQVNPRPSPIGLASRWCLDPVDGDPVLHGAHRREGEAVATVLTADVLQAARVALQIAEQAEPGAARAVLRIDEVRDHGSADPPGRCHARVVGTDPLVGDVVLTGDDDAKIQVELLGLALGPGRDRGTAPSAGGVTPAVVAGPLHVGPPAVAGVSSTSADPPSGSVADGRGATSVPAVVAELLGAGDRVEDADVPLGDLGLDSVLAQRLAVIVRRRWAVDLGVPDLLAPTTTVGSLAALLSSGP